MTELPMAKSSNSPSPLNPVCGQISLICHLFVPVPGCPLQLRSAPVISWRSGLLTAVPCSLPFYVSLCPWRTSQPLPYQVTTKLPNPQRLPLWSLSQVQISQLQQKPIFVTLGTWSYSQWDDLMLEYVSVFSLPQAFALTASSSCNPTHTYPFLPSHSFCLSFPPI